MRGKRVLRIANPKTQAYLFAYHQPYRACEHSIPQKTSRFDGVVPRQSRSCIPFQLKLHQSAHNLTDIETRQLNLKSEQAKVRVNLGSEPYFRFSLWSDCRGSMFARVAARRQRKSLKKESFLFLIFGTFLQRKVHHRFSFPRDKKHGRQKPPASFLFYREFVICLFAFLYDKSVFKGGFIK
jgi:hypothetical protein